MVVSNSRPLRKVLPSIIFELFNYGMKNGVHFVQVGANDGVLSDPIYQLIKDYGWKGIRLEPHPVYYERLSLLHENDPNILPLHLGCSDKDKMLPLYYLKTECEHIYREGAKGCASLDKNWLIGKLATEGGKYREEHIGFAEVMLQPLRDILERQGITTTDVLIIDVEGHEMEVLAGADLDRMRPKLAVVECQNRRSRKQILMQFEALNYSTMVMGHDIYAFSQAFPDLPEIGEFARLFEFPGTTPQ